MVFSKTQLDRFRLKFRNQTVQTPLRQNYGTNYDIANFVIFLHNIVNPTAPSWIVDQLFGESIYLLIPLTGIEDTERADLQSPI